MGKVAYVHVDADGRFQFYNADGSENVIAGEPVEFDESYCAYLDTVAFIKRAKPVPEDGGEEA